VEVIHPGRPNVPKAELQEKIAKVRQDARLRVRRGLGDACGAAAGRGVAKGAIAWRSQGRNRDVSAV
jgi:hypothetical protein